MSQSKLIYFIDDDIEDLQLMQEISSSFGHHSKTFRSGEELSAAIKTGLPVPDLFFIDVVMPMIDGYEILSILKANPKYAASPILVHSAKCDPECVSKCYQMGANYFLRKAFSFQGLKSTIEHALSKDWSTFKAGREDFLFQY
jgi:CheY-like chemotaxis protein